MKKKKKIPNQHNIILELVRHTDPAVAANGYQSHAEPNANGTPDEGGGGGLLALICASLCKDTPLAEAFGPATNDNANNNNAQPLLTPVQNGESHFSESSEQRTFTKKKKC